jgi:hypothetical protein
LDRRLVWPQNVRVIRIINRGMEDRKIRGRGERMRSRVKTNGMRRKKRRRNKRV